MDQLKAYSAVAAKHWFWISTAAITLLSIGIWWMSSGRLLSEYDTARTQLDSDAAKISSVRMKLKTHPNEISHRKMEELIEARTEAVMEAWESVFSRQQEILKWPVKELKQDFVDQFRDLIPIEKEVSFPTPEEEEVVPAYRSRYRDYIGGVLPDIAKIAKTEWTAKFDSPSAGGMGGYGGGMEAGYDPGGMEEGYDPGGGEGGYDPSGLGMGATGVPVKEGPLVSWKTSSQEKLLSDLFPWRGGQPSTLDVLYSQENLWILRQLMQIIADVNGDAGQKFQAKIRGIEAIAIGRSVPKTAGTISKPGAAAAGGGYGAEDLYGGMDGSGGGSGGEDLYGPGGMDGGSGDGMGMGMAVVEATDPGDNRYVDTQGIPLTAAQLRAALSSNAPTDAFMAVAKRVPVMMSFKMHQQSVPELLAACGSAPLMVEVRQVRILAPGAAAGGAMGDMGDMGGGYDGGMDAGGYGGMDTGGGETLYGSAPTAAAGGAAEKFPLDMTVEVYGIIYIYNPPQTEALGVDQVTEDVVVEGTALGEGRPAEAGEGRPAEPAPEPATEPAPAAEPDQVPQADAASAPNAAPQPPGTAPQPAAAPEPGAGPQPGTAPQPAAEPQPDAAPVVEVPVENPAPAATDGADRGPASGLLRWELRATPAGLSDPLTPPVSLS